MTFASTDKPLAIGFGITCLPALVLLPNLYFSLICSCDPMLISANMIARSVLKMTSIQIALFGGVYFGIGESNFEIEPYPIESAFVRYSMLYSLLPASLAMYVTHVMQYDVNSALGKEVEIDVDIEQTTSLMMNPGFAMIISLQIAT